MNVCGLCLLLFVEVCFTATAEASWWFMGSLGSRLVCDHVPGLVTRQRQMCRQFPSVMKVIGAGVSDWIHECQHQFRTNRWNCNTTNNHTLFGRLLLRGSREVAFLYAISSAGVVHSVARACSQGALDSCSCDPGKKGRSRDERGSFDWGGCSDHVDHAVRVSQAFVDARERKERDARALMNLHNNRAGRKAVRRFLSLQCKCHGVSGSCTLRTCWLALSDFRRTGDHLVSRYRRAAQLSINQYGTGSGAGFTTGQRRGPEQRRPGKHDLVYLEESPDYCTRDPHSGTLGTAGRLCSRTSRGVEGCDIMCCGRGYDTARVRLRSKWTLGTAGRLCSRTSRGVEGCDIMCCGRGYDTARVRLRSKCECKFHWCCSVLCQDCEREEDVHVCKGHT